MFNLFEEKPDHPLFDLEEARRLIGELPEDDHRKALEDIAFWLESIPGAKGFRPELRAAIILLLDETALPLYGELLQQYLSAPHLQDFKGLHQWQALHAYAKVLAAAYAASVDEYRRSDKKPFEFKQQLPLFCVRWLRAAGEQLKLELMRYLDIESGVWRQLADAQRFIENEQIAGSMVLAYPGHVIHTNPQRELLRTLLLYVAAPDEMAPDHIEVCFRITGRMSSFFDIANQPGAACPWCFDLASGAPPRRAEGAASAEARYFGAVRALPALDKIEKQNEDDPAWQERRFGNEFMPSGKLTVLKHLMHWWQERPPVHHRELHGIHASVEVVHGFRLISQLVARVELGEQEAEHTRALGLAADEQLEYSPETWTVADIGADEIGIRLGRSLGNWVKIGDLCGIKTQNNSLWWIGTIRRAHADADGVYLTLAILARKPLSIWLRALGKGAELASNWETSSGSFQYTYLPVILLPDEHNSYLHATMLMESGAFVAGNIYQAMMGGDKTRDIRLEGLQAEGEDYEQVRFAWIEPSAPPP